MVLAAIFFHVVQLCGTFLWDIFRGPNLSMWVRVRAAHDGALVFKDLDMVDIGLRSRCVIDVDPSVDDGQDLGL